MFLSHVKVWSKQVIQDGPTPRRVQGPRLLLARCSTTVGVSPPPWSTMVAMIAVSQATARRQRRQGKGPRTHRLSLRKVFRTCLTMLLFTLHRPELNHRTMKLQGRLGNVVFPSAAMCSRGEQRWLNISHTKDVQ